MAAINSFQNPFGGLGQGGGLNLPAHQNVAPVDPLGRALDVYNSISQGQRASAELEMQKQKQQQAMLEIEGEKRRNSYFMKNYDPATNTVDHVKYMLDVGEDPLTTKYAAETYKWLADNDQTQAQTAKTALDNTQTKTDMMARQANALLEQYAAQGQHVPKGAAAAQVAEWLSKGWITGDQAQGITLGMVGPEAGSQQLDLSFRKAAMIGQQSAEAMKRLQGDIQQIDTGNALVTQEVGPGGQITTKQVLPKGLTPGEANEIVKLDQPDGSTIQVRKGDLAAQQGQQAQPGQVPGAAPGLSPIGQSQTPQEAQEITAQVKDDADFRTTLRAEGGEAEGTLGLLDIVSKNLPNIKTGGGGSFYLTLGKIAQAAGADQSLIDKISPNMTSQEVVNSLNNTLALKFQKDISKQPNRDLAEKEFARIVGGGFSLDNTPEANARILAFYKGIAKLKAMENRAFNEWVNKDRLGPDGKPAYNKGKNSIQEFQRQWPSIQRKLIQKGILNGGHPLDDNGDPIDAQ